ncbi:MAG: polyphosphate kinase 1 [Deltaproteobacteria bacterium]|nr:MAG: polyphosphate kinase 1 [Deltaproteobacteria bacterium]
MRDSAERFFNRELSWLDFDRRVLELARDAGRPILERAKFLAIFSRNLDEFFQVRVSELQDLVAERDDAPAPDGLTPAAQLAAIRERVLELTAAAHETFERELRPALRGAGIDLVHWHELSDDERAGTLAPFDEQISPVLIPLGVDPTHPFPFVSGLSLSVGAFVQAKSGGPRRLARVKVPGFLPRWWEVGPGRYTPVEELIRAHFGLLFPEDEVAGASFFRVTRDADLELDEERGTADLFKAVEASLYRRRRASDAVRLEVARGLDPRIRDLLLRELRLERDELYESPGLLDLGALFELTERGPSEHRDAPWTPAEVFRGGRGGGDRASDAVFRTLRERDVLVHHPYESFDSSVGAFLTAAAEDPAVRVIMTTLYRAGGSESSIVQALQGAAARGKQIVVLVELKARFDEAHNLERARALERAGAHVVYGVLGLKTHTKLAFAVREENTVLRRYCHVATGNYNPVTATLYEDLGLLTSREDITRDVAELFQRLTSGSGARSYEKLLVAPEGLRAGMLERIARQARPGGRIAMKLNGLSDPAIIDALYAASGSGAEIELVVRGICCLRPGVAGLSERIRVRSVLGRYLEHSRIFRFGEPGQGRGEVWIGSADLMQRNLDLRVEALVLVEDPALVARIDALLAVYLDPESRLFALAPDGSWKATGSVDVQDRLRALTPAPGSATA